MVSIYSVVCKIIQVYRFYSNMSRTIIYILTGQPSSLGTCSMEKTLAKLTNIVYPLRIELHEKMVIVPANWTNP
jgi:hypothetical protein